MKPRIIEKRNVSVEKAIEILKRQGTVVTSEEATIILNFMYFLGKLAVNEYVLKNENR